MEWEIKFYKDKKGNYPVKQWIDELDEKVQNKILRTLYLLKELGLNLPQPHCKYIEGGMWELRIPVGKDKYRILYFAHTGNQFILLHGFRKVTKKTPKKEKELAIKRMEDHKNE